MTGSPPDPPVFPDLGKAAELLAAGELPVDPLLARRKLAGRVPDEVARAAIELADLRRRAAPKFRDPDSMWLTRKGLEQSTRLAVADWRASEVARLDPGARVWDRTAGLGADCLALARAGLVLVASELDPLHAACCRANLATAGVEAPVRCGDSLRQDEPCDLVVLDPDRRPASEIGEGGRPGGGRRRLDATAFAPPVRTWPTALGAGRGGWIKLPPGLDPAVLEAELGTWLEDTPHRWTWIEEAGDLCELTLWTGALAPPEEPHRAAVRLNGGIHRLAADGPAPFPGPSPDPDAVTLLAEPRPSVLRAGLVELAAERAGHGLAALDPEVAYLASSESGPAPDPNPFLDLFRVVASSPLDRKRVRRLLAEHDIGALTVKKRGLPETAEALGKRFRGKGSRPGLVVVTPTPSGRRLYLVERISMPVS